MVDLSHKTVANRRSRPSWATNDKQLMEKCVGARPALLFRIAVMYWQQNMSTSDIALAVDMKHDAVRKVITRLLCK